ncbi:MAG: glycosyltransferase family 4 protein [Pleurocapsa sp. SU_5_0]|nr:glycosyltransferase family 4 protein [Pleurocapsa sp. SU_5_0]NJR46485.1 glycosyltransferase family 4 protein [Hyellaceae cyanobacterium CSU_1_1]
MHVFIAALHRPVKPTGVCRHAANLARAVAEQSEITKVSLVIGSWQQHYFETAFSLDSDKIKLVVVNIKNSSLVRNIWFLSGLPKLANQLNCDLVHLSFPFPFLRTQFKAPVVTTIHDLYPYECPENFGFPQVWFNQLFLRQAIGNSNGLPCVSQVTAEKLRQYFPQLRPDQLVKVIYNYVDFKNLETTTPKAIKEDSKFLLSVAQHRQNKNLDLLIKAYAQLRLNGQIEPDYQLIIVGTKGPETEKLENLIANLNLSTSVKFLSAINDSELGWLYQNCQLFAIPSSTEGFCLPLAEALHFSDRLVCSDIPIFREIASANCVYFSLSGNALDNLSQALTQALNRQNSLPQDAGKRFDKSTIAQQYLNLYQLLM